MKIKIFFLISAMNALSYLCFGNCCGDCCGDCWEKEENGKKDKNEENGKEKGKENGKEKDNNPEYFVDADWLDKKQEQENFVLKLFNKEEEKKYKSKDGIQLELEVKEGNKTVIKDLDKLELKPDTHKWALFEIKYKKEGEEKGEEEGKFVYLYCSDIESVEVNDFMTSIFEYKKNFFSISILACDTSSVIDMSWMFLDCSNLGDLDLSKFDTSSVKNMGYMFCNCKSLKKLDLPNFDTSKVESMNCMFDDCKSLNEVTVSNLETKDEIFKELGGKEKGWEESKKDDKFILIKVEEEK